MARTALVVDSDGGIDDCTALSWLLSCADVELIAVIGTWGNVDRDVAAGNVRRVLHAGGRDDVPVALGAAGPIGPAPLAGRATSGHGADGLGGHAARWPTGPEAPHPEPAGAFLSRLATYRPGELHLLTLGPLSTLAGALAADPGLAARLTGLTIMGGAVTAPGNASPVAETNVGRDPEAAAGVLAAAWPEPPLLVGLDVTRAARLDVELLELAGGGQTAAARMLAGPLEGYAASYGGASFPCHDLLAAMAAVDPSVLTEVSELPTAVDTGGSAAWGATVADRRERPHDVPPGFHRCRIAVSVDADRFRDGFRALMTAPAS